MDERTKWDIVAGGVPFKLDNDSLPTNPLYKILPPRGVFGEFPGATPKYALNDKNPSPDFRETMARMFMAVPSYTEFVKESALNANVNQIATVLGGEATNGGTTGGNGYVDFLLQSVQHSFQEKAQVVEVLADDHVAYFFGQAAPTFAYGGTLLNTKQDDQASNMQLLYANFGRGSQLAARKTLISLRYDGIFVSGVMMNLQYSLNAETEMAVPFSFNLLVKQFQILPNKYTGLVTLSTAFATRDNKYQPFSQGGIAPGEDPAEPEADPGPAAKIVPAATGATATEKAAAAANAGTNVVGKLKAKTVRILPKGTLSTPANTARLGG